MSTRLRLFCMLCALLAAEGMPAHAQDVNALWADADRFFGEQKWDDAIAKYDQILRLKPHDTYALDRRGCSWMGKGDLNRALDDLNAAIKIMPNYALALNDRGVAYSRLGMVEAALKDYAEAARCDPDYAERPLFNHALLSAQQQDFQAAIADLSKIIQINGASAEAFRQRGAAWAELKEWDSAIKDYRQSVRLDPTWAADYAKVLSDLIGLNPETPSLSDALAWLKATCRDKSERDGKHAVTLAMSVCDLTQYKNWAYLATLAAAYAEAGDFDNAVTWSYGALDIAPDAEKAALMARAAQFEKRQPYRDVLANLAYRSPRQTDGFPRVTASYTSRYDKIEMVNDGRIVFKPEPHNRWTSYESTSPTDWLEIDFGEAKEVSRVNLYIYDDHGGVQPPKSFVVQAWDGSNWQPVANQSGTPKSPTGGVVNTARFDATTTSKLRVVFTHNGASRSGLTEIEVSKD